VVAQESGVTDFRAQAVVLDGPAEALVIACSDGRFREATNEFLDRYLMLRSWEVISVPGGAYMLSFAEALPKQLKVGMRMVKGVLKDRGPSRIILVGHEDCARYVEGFASRLRRGDFSLAEKQQRDLMAVSRELAETFNGTRVEAYFASLQAGSAVFTKL
jgi:hypothetical protein